MDGGFLRHPEGRRLHGDLRRAVHRRHGVGGHRAHLGREVLAGRQGVLRHPVPPGRQNPVLGGGRREPAQADAQGPAEILAHQFEILLRPQTPDLQGLPPAHGRRLRRAERYARTRRGRRHGDLQRLGRRRRQHAQDQACRQPDDGLSPLERLCQGHRQRFARVAGSADRLRRFDGRIDRPAPRLPRLEERHADRPAEDSVGTRRADRQGEPYKHPTNNKTTGLWNARESSS